MHITDYLSDKLDSLIPTLSEINVSVKFAYPVPFTNNTIEFSIDEILTLHDGNVQQGEKAFFARTVGSQTPCFPCLTIIISGREGRQIQNL